MSERLENKRERNKKRKIEKERDFIAKKIFLIVLKEYHLSELFMNLR